MTERPIPQGVFHAFSWPSDRLRAADVFPDLRGVGGTSDLSSIVGALLTVVLIIAVLMLDVPRGFRTAG
jgi:hypothetical protein